MKLLATRCACSHSMPSFTPDTLNWAASTARCAHAPGAINSNSSTTNTFFPTVISAPLSWALANQQPYMMKPRTRQGNGEAMTQHGECRQIPIQGKFPHLGIMDTYSPGRLAMNTAALADVDSLPRTPASDVKKLGWRGVMRNVARDGRVLVTNHAQPEAVILSVAEYQAMLAALRSKAERDQHALERLRHEFDQRLACLNAPDTGEKIDALFAQPLQLHGKVFTGKDY
ncbi:hypothetical protein CO610_09755 [Lysobacteraceae bacterium NML95-0200]|nr:hypothetical protein CO610_09755 [Xanthomonadaceae bacterium NML95-0200]